MLSRSVDACTYFAAQWELRPIAAQPRRSIGGGCSLFDAIKGSVTGDREKRICQQP